VQLKSLLQKPFPLRHNFLNWRARGNQAPARFSI
jgi:hypothetical protein